MQAAQHGQKEGHVCNDADATEMLMMTVNKVQYASTKDCI
jgi:hypothetical protein